MVSVPVMFDSAKADVGDLAKAAAAADTPHRDSRGAPSATLVLPAPHITAANAKKDSTVRSWSATLRTVERKR